MKTKLLAALLLVCVLLTGTASAAWSPVDFAGGSLSGITADGDALIISDVFNKVIWQADADGVEQIAGRISIPGLNGEPIGKYEDGTLDTALFMEPWAITPFLNGYAVSDSAANVIRFFDETGVYTAVGSGSAGSQNGTGTKASFDNPTGLATGDAGEVYIADTNNGTIRIMDTEGKVSTLLSGLVEPTGLAYSGGHLYIAETGRNRILKVTGSKYEVIAGESGAAEEDYYPGAYVDGPVAKARFDHPQGVAVGSDGAIYVSDTGNHAVRMIKGGRVYTLAVSRSTPEAPVQPRGILVKGSALYVTDLFAQNILELDVSPVSYKDVPANEWYADSVTEATLRGLTDGTDEGIFSPEAPLTRATLVVMLSRLHTYADGSAVINGDAGFTDVAANAWYAPAVRWAADRGILEGYDDGSFRPDAAITREQLAAILYRYAVAEGYDVSVGESTNILSYTDAFDIEEYAVPAMQWACGTGILSGFEDGSLRPAGAASRSQTAKMLIYAMDAFGM